MGLRSSAFAVIWTFCPRRGRDWPIMGAHCGKNAGEKKGGGTRQQAAQGPRPARPRSSPILDPPRACWRRGWVGGAGRSSSGLVRDLSLLPKARARAEQKYDVYSSRRSGDETHGQVHTALTLSSQAWKRRPVPPKNQSRRTARWKKGNEGEKKRRSNGVFLLKPRCISCTEW